MGWMESKRIGYDRKKKKEWDYFYNEVIREFNDYYLHDYSKIEFGYNVYRGIK